MRNARINPVFELARAALAERYNTDQNWSKVRAFDKRAAAVALTGVDPAISRSRTYHPRRDSAIVRGRGVARRITDQRDLHFLQSRRGRTTFTHRAPTCDFQHLLFSERFCGGGERNCPTGGQRAKFDERNIVGVRLRIITVIEHNSRDRGPVTVSHVVGCAGLDFYVTWPGLLRQAMRCSHDPPRRDQGPAAKQPAGVIANLQGNLPWVLAN